jgi:hypothetical protein
MKRIIFTMLVMGIVSTSTFGQGTSAKDDKVGETILSENVLNSNRASGCVFLVLQDNLPWSTPAVTDILTANGEIFSVANSATFPGLNFDDYDVIIVCSDQRPEFHTVFAANFTKFENFVLGGGSLEVHAATCGHNSPCGYSVLLPGGVYTTEQYDNYNNVVMGAHPIVAGVGSPFSGNYASHGFFSNLVTGTEIITETTSNNKPTTIQYYYGSGVVTATTCTYEWGYSHGQEAGEMLVNNLNYSCDHAQAANVPVGPWAMIIGIFMIVGFTIYRVRKS